MKVGFVGTFKSESLLFWFAPLMEKQSSVLHDMELFMEAFHAAFGDSDCKKVAQIKMKSPCQGSCPIFIYAAKFQQLTCDFKWNDRAFINHF